DHTGLASLQGVEIASGPRGMIRRDPRQPIRLAGQELGRVLDELNSREAAVPDPDTFYSKASEKYVAIPGFRLNFQVNGVPARFQREDLRRPLRQTRRRPKTTSKANQCQCE